MQSNKKQSRSKTSTSAIRLTDLIDYQKDSVVSRTLIDKRAGTLTLFAFGQGQGLSEHTAPYEALANIIDGEAEIIISGRITVVKTGEIITIPANEPHAVKAVKPFKMMLIMIRK